jgi:hypothetical protein
MTIPIGVSVCGLLVVVLEADLSGWQALEGRVIGTLRRLDLSEVHSVAIHQKRTVRTVCM